MARIRSIHPGIFTDEAFMELTVEAPLAIPLLLGLWTEADDRGVFQARALTLKARLLPAVAVAVEPLLAELERRNFIRRFTMDGREYGAVRNFQRYQRPKKPKITHPLPTELLSYVGRNTTGSEPSDDEGGDEEEPGADQVDGVPYQFPTGGENCSQREEGGGKRIESFALLSDRGADAPSPEPPKTTAQQKPRRSVQRPEPEGFPDFYAAYPRHEARKDAADAYRQVVAEVGGLEALLAHLRRYRFDPNPKFIPLPATWLRGRRWQDEQRPREVAAAPSRELDERYWTLPFAEVRALPKPPLGTSDRLAWDEALFNRRPPRPRPPRQDVAA